MATMLDVAMNGICDMGECSEGYLRIEFKRNWKSHQTNRMKFICKQHETNKSIEYVDVWKIILDENAYVIQGIKNSQCRVCVYA